MTAPWENGGRWPRVALGKLCNIQLGKMLQPVPNSATDELTPYLRAGSLSDLDNVGDLPQMYTSLTDRVTYGVEEGDLLVAEGGDTGRTAFAPEVPTGTIIQNSLHRLRPHRLDRRFLRYYLESVYFSGWLEVLCNKSTFGHLTREKLASLTVPLAPSSAQEAIAELLDRQTTHIDALITAKRRMMSVLDTRPWHVFLELLSATDSPAVPIRRILSFLTDGPFGSAFSSADYTEEGAVAVRLGNIGFAEYRDADQARIPLDMFERLLRHRVLPGDLLIAGLGDSNNHAGRACVAPDLGDAIVKGKCFCGRVRPTLADASFVALLLSSSLGAELIGTSTRGSTRSMINLEVVKNTLIPLPSIEAQRDIVARTMEAKAATTRIVGAIARQIDLLLEHRQELITAAVTGQLEIPGVAA